MAARNRTGFGLRSIGVVLAAGSLTLLASCGGGGAPGSTSAGDPVPAGTVRVVGFDDQDFDADRYEVEALGEPGVVTIEYVLDGFQAHTLVVEGHEDLLRLEVGNDGTDAGTIRLEPGRYMIYCDIAGHRSSGMEAQLLVK